MQFYFKQASGSNNLPLLRLEKTGWKRAASLKAPSEEVQCFHIRLNIFLGKSNPIMHQFKVGMGSERFPED